MSFTENYLFFPNINLTQNNIPYDYSLNSTKSLDVRNLVINLFPHPFTNNFTTDITIRFYVNNQLQSTFQAYTQAVTSFSPPINLPLINPFILNYGDDLKLETTITNCSPPPDSFNYIEFQQIQLQGYALPIIYSIVYDRTQAIPSANFNICGENFTNITNVNVGGVDISFNILNDSDISAYSPLNYGMVKLTNNYGSFNSVDISNGSQGYGPNVYYWTAYEEPFIMGNLTLPSCVVGESRVYIELDPSGPLEVFEQNYPLLINIGSNSFTKIATGPQYPSYGRYFTFETNESLLTTDSSYISITYRDISGVERVYSSINGIYKSFEKDSTIYNPYRYDGFFQVLSEPLAIDFNPKKAIQNASVNITTSQIVVNQFVTDVKLNDAIVPDISYGIFDLSSIIVFLYPSEPESKISICNTDTINTTCGTFDICYGNMSVLPVIKEFTADPSNIAIGSSSTINYDMTMNFSSADICGTNLTILPSGELIVTPANKGNNIYELNVTNPLGTVTSFLNIFTYSAPIIDSFTPTSGPENIVITLSGEFYNITNAKIGVKDVSFSVINYNEMEVISTDISGYISVTNNLGTGISSTEFILTPLYPLILDLDVNPKEISYNYIGNINVSYDLSNVSQVFLDGSANINNYSLPNLTTGSITIPLPLYSYVTLFATNKYGEVSESFYIEVIPGYDSYDRKVCFRKCDIIPNKQIKNNYDSHSTEISRISNLLEHSSTIRNKTITYANKQLNVYKRWNGAPGGSGSSIQNSFI